MVTPGKAPSPMPSPKELSSLAAYLRVMVIALVVILLGVDLKVSYDREFEIARRDSVNLLKQLEGQISGILVKSDLVLQEVVRAYEPAMQGKPKGSQEQINRQLLELMRNIPETQKESLRLINAEGRVVFNAGETAELPKVVVADRAYFLTQKNHPDAGLVFSEPLLSRFTGKWLITLSRRFNNPDGSFAGVAQVAVRADALQEIFERITLGTKASVALFDAETRLVSRQPLLQDQLGKQIAAVELRQGLASGANEGHYRAVSRIDGVSREFSYLKLEAFPMVVVLGVAPEEFLAGWYTKASLYGLCAALSAFMLYGLWRAQRQAEVEKEQNLQERYARLAAEEMAHSKGELLDVIRHELRTPMNGILGATQLLELTELNKEQSEYVEMARNCGESLLSLISQILEYSQWQAGQYEGQRESFTLANVMDDVMRGCLGKINAKPLKLVWAGDPSLGTECSGDPSLLEKLVNILVDNAIKFTDEGQVTVEARLQTEGEGQCFHCRVADTGPGVSPEARAKLFKPFSQGDSSATRRHGGVGLGLAIAKLIVDHLGGEIGYESEAGKGACFWFSIPLVKA